MALRPHPWPQVQNCQQPWWEILAENGKAEAGGRMGIDKCKFA